MKTYPSFAAILGVLLALTTATAQQFTEITTDPVVTDLGGGGFGGWADYDNDGYADLFVFRDLGTTAIYRNNRNGTFSSIPKPPGLAAASFYTAYWCDWDNDGNQDLYALVDGTPYRIRRRPRRFRSRILHSGLRLDGSLCRLRPGRVDRQLSVGGKLPGPQSRKPRLHHLYLGRRLGPAAANTYGGPCWGDFDDDGWPDLYVPSLWDGATCSETTGTVASKPLITWSLKPLVRPSRAPGAITTTTVGWIFVRGRWNGSAPCTATWATVSSKDPRMSLPERVRTTSPPGSITTTTGSWIFGCRGI
jgi:hypothetical protein